MPGSSGRRALVALLAAHLLGVAACARPELPRSLAGLPRGRVITGSKAAAMMAELHGRPVAPHSSMVAQYGRRNEVRLWLSRYTDASEARRVVETMVAGIQRGGTPFHPPWSDGEARGRWLTYGAGGHHALWAAGSTVYWLEAEPAFLFEALAQLPKPAGGEWT